MAENRWFFYYLVMFIVTGSTILHLALLQGMDINNTTLILIVGF